MDHSIKKVAVLGAGTMSTKLGHFSNAGISSFAF